MAYGLISTEEMEISLWVLNEMEDYDYKTYVTPAGTVMDLVMYDGESKYEAPKGYRLDKVPDEANIGDTGY